MKLTNVPSTPAIWTIDIAVALSLSGNQVDDTFELTLITKLIPKHATT